MFKHLKIAARILPDGQPNNVIGRDAWALLELCRCGLRGCTPIDNPGAKWSAYVHKPRTRYRLSIENLYENHSWQYAGTQAHYVLLPILEILDDETAPELAVQA